MGHGIIPGMDDLDLDRGLLPPPPEFLACPGDVLLLRSAGTGAGLLARHGNLAAQRLMCGLRPARFTHVAMVVNAHQIAEALPGRGVRLRSWRDAAPGYDLGRSQVVRHRELGRDPSAAARVLQAYHRLHRQPYHLLRALRASRVIDRDHATVCSVFVSDMLTLLGVSGPRSVLTAVLPADIDHHCRRHSAWQRMALRAHGFSEPFKDLRRAPPTRAELAEIEAHVLPQVIGHLGPVSAAARQQARAVADRSIAQLADAIEHRPAAHVMASLTPLFAAIQHDEAGVQATIMPLLDQLEAVIDAQQQARQRIDELNQEMLRIQQALTAQLNALRA